MFSKASQLKEKKCGKVIDTFSNIWRMNNQIEGGLGVGCGFKEKKSFIFFRFFSSYILVAGCWKETTHVYPHKHFFFFLYFFLFFFRGTCYHVGWLVRAFCADDVNYSILSFSSSFVFIVFLYTRQYASSTINIQIWTFKKQKKKTN